MTLTRTLFSLRVFSTIEIAQRTWVEIREDDVFGHDPVVILRFEEGADTDSSPLLLAYFGFSEGAI